ncbi:GNAT family N-acetyltransferase [Gordonia sp. DT30]|uniref:GNAT family N-acetyltransferase n=1 Tax=Gordonia sp. DT30 TaxID=3416546 RepID=UPI003CF0140B
MAHENQAGLSTDPYLIVEYEWLRFVDADLRKLLADFAESAFIYDREAGFTQISEFRRGGTEDGRGLNRHLVVSVTERDKERRIVGYLSIVHVEDGVGTAILVIDPEYRSRGIATLLAEKLQVESPNPADWFDTGLSGLQFAAAGPHPAAERLARRMGVPVVDQRWLLIRSLRGPVAHPALFGGARVDVSESDEDPDVSGPREHTRVLLEDHPQFARAEKIVRREYSVTDDKPLSAIVRYSLFADGVPSRLAFIEFGRSSLAEAREPAIEALIDAATSDLWSAGVKAVLASVDPNDGVVVRTTRRRYFQHDQTDLTFGIDVKPN